VVSTLILAGLIMTADASPETKALQILQSLLKVERPLTTKLLSGGLSGSELIKVNTSNKTFVVRFWNMKWAEYFPQDLACQIIASNSGYGPQVFFTDEAAGITVIEYLTPEPFPETQIRLQALIDLVKKIHSGPAVPYGINKATDLDESIEEILKFNLSFLDLNRIKAVKEAVFAATRHHAYLACHRDLHPGNLIYTQGRFVAIDYTWGGMDDPYTDLATLAIFNCGSLDEEQLLLRLYLGRAPHPAEIARLSLMKQQAKIFYGLEFFKLASVNALSSPPKAGPKSYLNFGRYGEAPSLDDILEYGASLLGEVVDFSYSEQYIHDIALLQNQF
jgi:aminoglycoside phosphotransferase (APT) family kinase protein